MFANGNGGIASKERLGDEAVPCWIEEGEAGVVFEFLDVTVGSVGEGGIPGLEFLCSEGDGSTPVIREGEHEGEFFYVGECFVGGGDVLGDKSGLDDVVGGGTTVDLRSFGWVKEIGDCLSVVFGTDAR